MYRIAAGRHLDFLKWMAAQDEVSKEAGLAAVQLYAHMNGDDWDFIGIAPVTTPEQEKLADEIAAARKEYPAAIAHLERAVRLEDGLVYTEPAEWHYPPRHALGAVLLEAGRAREAETVYWEDLRRNRENGWALYGLTKALEAQGKTEQAALMRSRFEKAWARADVKLDSSRMHAEATE